MNQKPKWKTTEFWLSLIAMIAGLLMTSGIIETGAPLDKGLGVVISALAAFGYSVNRTAVKSINEKQDGESAKKPGYKTTEFWATTATMASSAILASGVTGGEGLEKEIGMLAATVGALGYGGVRGKLKVNGAAKLIFFPLLTLAIACTPAKAVDSRYKAIAPEYYNLLHSSTDKKYTEKRLQIRENTIDAWCLDAGLPIALWGVPALKKKRQERLKSEREKINPPTVGKPNGD